MSAPENPPRRFELAAAQPSLAGASAVVTGAGRGIGRAIALELAARGADVLVHTGARQEAAEAVAAEIRQSGREATVVVCDLAEPSHHESLLRAALAWRRTLDIWINNAGADVLTGPAAQDTFETKLERLWQVDVRATIRLGRIVGAVMKQQGRGAILNMGWDQAQWGMAGDSGEMFAAVKGAVMAFSRSLARSLAPEVRVNCLAPGWIKTAWGQQVSDDWQARAGRESLLGRWGTPEDVARAACFLVSPEAAFINGQIVAINGGWRSPG